MDQNQRPSSASRAYQFHPGRANIINLFDLYLGRSSRQKPDDHIREPPNKTQKRVVALNRELAPRNEQFLSDFEQIQSQFSDQEQLRAVTESVLISLVVQCSGHVPRAEFLLFALRSLCSIGYINWDTFLPSLLSSVSMAETTVGQGTQTVASVSSQPAVLPSSNTISNSSNFQSSNPASPLPSVHGIGSPVQSSLEPAPCATLSPVKSSDISCVTQQSTSRVNSSIRDNAISSLRQLCCKIILAGLEFNLKPVTLADIFTHMLNWLVNWDQRQQGIDGSDGLKSWKPDKALIEWLHSCLDVIWLLVEEDKCRVPFYELLRSGLQFIENIPDDEALFTLILEIHRRRDMMAMHMQMLDQHLHCPTFGTQRIFSQIIPNSSGEPVTGMRYSPITYPSVLGEPMHGEDLATSIQKGSLDWERALRCIRHAFRTTPSPDWWKRVLLVAPCHRSQTQAPTPGAVFSSEMICEGTIERFVELLKLTNSDINCWQEWCVFSDIFYFLIKSGCIEFADFVDKMVLRLTEGGDHHILRTNHVTLLIAEIIRVELVINALNNDARKVETTRKIMSFHREDRSSDPNSPQGILLDFISSCQNLRIWSLNTSTREYLNSEQLQKGKQIDEWWRQSSKGDRMMDYMNMDDRSIGMFWVVTYTMAQPACEKVMQWLSSAGVTELLPGSSLQANDRLMVMREVSPLPMSLLSGFSMNMCLKLAYQMEESLFSGQVVPSIALAETYTRLLLLAPHSLIRSHFSNLAQRNPSILSKPGVTLLLLEIMNYRLLPLYRYQGKCKALMYDVTKIISALKGKRGDHRAFRLAENLCMNLILSLRDFFWVKREGKGPTEFTETLNRITVITYAIMIKTRGIADADHVLYLQTMVEQIMGATSQHTWSEKTLRHFPSVLRDAVIGRLDKRSLAIQEWQQAETTVLNQCTQLLSPSAEPNYLMTYISRSYPQHRHYLCAGAWILMQGRPENINSGNLARVLREFSPEEVTTNIYTMVDVLLHHIQLELQHGHSLQDLLLKTCANLAFFVWIHELLPLDILLLALIDRDDDPHALRIVIALLDRQELQQRVKLYCMNRGPSEHWLYSGMFKRNDLQKALGTHLSWKDRYPTFFDDIAARLLPVIPLIVYRLIENDAIDSADRILAMYTPFLAYHPLRFSFVRDILAYFYGHLPGKLIVRILNVLDLNKIPFTESFPQHISSANPVMCPPLEYFATLLLGLVNNVIPPLHSNSKSGSLGDTSSNLLRKNQATSQSGQSNASDSQKAFYQIQDPGTYTQLVLETAVIEILSLPVSASQIVSSLVQVVVNIQATLIQSNGLHGAPNIVGQGSVLPTSPSGGSTDSLGASRSTPSVSGINTSNMVSRSGYSSQQLSCLMIQACGLLLAQLPPDFHIQLYIETSRIIKETWWLSDGKRSLGELDSAVGYALLDPTWAAQDNTSTAIGNIVALLHSVFSNLPQEWLEGTHIIIKHLKPVTSVAMLRIVFRIMGPLLPRLANAHTLFSKTLSLLLSTMVDVFGNNAQPSSPAEASEITDLIDFLHHVVHYEGQGGPVQSSSKPRPEVLAIFGRVLDTLHPDVRHLLSHLRPDVNCSIYAATHPKLAQNPSQSSLT
ncbi:mediator of RNA polymerase II transcription subunit 23 [Humulus lupulus]|uniref:mediator of RNA polymerase II transcription subunit 23 n=1 Tax=Humulus lupulus TaxID=3486 RepID=UPI002B40A62B|nr:mediator of RNA polymerase II transcription subunit 23 [Humulus lupulus]XP_062110171.1 mediator of RNA polymerase II transcription subunit 23 [Humulus lupulus]XP_062110172.1 mediator of RNA polymerase II transcription subunit 23 [Humulus lupulus]XP_062110173.1 mediator of RNA polymerase II transcription subunit 23 [Humulus lupulus]XP_062110174.1 mediator of RNA polymerase II transcription subunit 23 [Humulus lupulus]XP_062110175.1 mediator of RNA polymerase II transcription subunit 23 [Humu